MPQRSDVRPRRRPAAPSTGPAVKAARQAGGNVTLVLSILDRGEGAGALYAAEHIPFRSLFKASEFLAA